MAIVITGIVVAIVAMFIVRPIQGYMSSVARGEMVDAADNALRRMARELQRALPNSVRVSADAQYLEFVPVTAVGRYFAQDADGAKRLDFGVDDGSFELMSPTISLTHNQDLVFYNLGPGFAGSDVYEQGYAADTNRRQYTGATGTINSGGTIDMTATALPTAAFAPPYRFHAIAAPVTYRCAASAAPPFGVLTRHTGYGVLAGQPEPPTTGSSAVLASGVTACTFSYEADAIAARSGLVTLRLELSAQTLGSGQESVTLYHVVHVDNLP